MNQDFALGDKAQAHLAADFEHGDLSWLHATNAQHNDRFQTLLDNTNMAVPPLQKAGPPGRHTDPTASFCEVEEPGGVRASASIVLLTHNTPGDGGGFESALYEFGSAEASGHRRWTSERIRMCVVAPTSDRSPGQKEHHHRRS
jgi:hypothetical protein